jgi:protein SCO1/2
MRCLPTAGPGGRRRGLLWRLVFLGILLIADSASAALPGPALERVGVSLAPNAQMPTGLPLLDEYGAQRTLAEILNGRPSLLILADYACSDLCGPVLTLASASLEQSGLRPDRDYHMVVIGLRANGEAAAARAAKRARIGEDVARASTFLTADAATLEKITAALGYRFAEDSENRQIAHPAAAFVLTAAGRVTRVLSGLALDPTDLKLALLEAGEGHVGGFADRALLLCYGFDPAAGVYTLSIHRLVVFLSLLTAALLAGFIGMMLSREGHALY